MIGSVVPRAVTCQFPLYQNRVSEVDIPIMSSNGEQSAASGTSGTPKTPDTSASVAKKVATIVGLFFSDNTKDFNEK